MKTKKIIYLLLLFCSVAAIFLAMRYFTDGFRINKIIGKIPFDETFSSLTKEPPDLLLNQPYRYLGKGKQAFVFSSEDEKYVLKFIATQKYNDPFRRRLLKTFNKPLLAVFQKYLDGRTFNRKRNFKRSIESYCLAYDQLKEETGLIYLHLKKTDLCKKITLIDKLGMAHEIDLNSTYFILQKKANSLKSTITLTLKKKDKKKMQRIIDDYLKNSFKTISKGIVNKDSSVKNSGYIETQFVEYDIGRFEKINEINSKNFISYIQYFRKYLEKNDPNSLEYFDEKASELKNNFSF